MGYIVVVDQIKPPPAPPDGLEEVRVEGVSDAGNNIISTWFGREGANLSHFGGGTNMSFPRWVLVKYRGLILDPLTGKKKYRGDVLAEYHVEVLSRIPGEVFKVASAKRGRAIRLKFRIKEDGVLFGWDVQEMNLEKKTLKYDMIGGDFLDDMNGHPFKPRDLIDMTKGE